jgi:hypothetical protein
MRAPSPGRQQQARCLVSGRSCAGRRKGRPTTSRHDGRTLQDGCGGPTSRRPGCVGRPDRRAARTDTPKERNGSNDDSAVASVLGAGRATSAGLRASRQCRGAAAPALPTAGPSANDRIDSPRLDRSAWMCQRGVRWTESRNSSGTSPRAGARTVAGIARAHRIRTNRFGSRDTPLRARPWPDPELSLSPLGCRRPGRPSSRASRTPSIRFLASSRDSRW